MDPSLYWKKLLHEVHEKKSTDIHFSAGRVFIRLNMGILPMSDLKEDYEKVLTFLADPAHLKVLHDKGEVDFAASHDGHRMRCNIYKSSKGICGAFRPLPSKSFPWDKMLLSREVMNTVTTSNQGLVLVTGPTGSGKCWGKGTKLMMFDGSLKKVEDIRPGDILMGPDSTPRTVLSITNDKGPLYQITPIKGDPWICNDVHVMTLTLPKKPKNSEENTQIIPVGDIPAIDIPLNIFLRKKEQEQEEYQLIRYNPHTKETKTIGWDAAPLGNGEYFGFELDGDGRCLLSDFTVTHNSTTLCSILDYINAKYAHKIITIEDPIEYLFTDRKSIIDQREIGPHTQGFHEALRVALRQNPNVIFVGEIRDYATALTALHAAETGHLVFSTLHTKRVANTVSRIIEMAPPGGRNEIRSVIANNVICVLCQRLLPKKDGNGIIPCREVLVMNPAASNYIKEGKEKSLPSVMNANREKGMIDWDSALNKLFNDGEISQETYEANQDKSDKIN